jgi:hypothetical protein
MTKIAGSGSESGSISQKHGSADPDLPKQNVMDPHTDKKDPGFRETDWVIHPDPGSRT